MAYTTINKSTDYFNTKLYTGNGGTNAQTGVGFQPDFTWIKNRDGTRSHYLFDAVRGATKELNTNNTNDENTNANGLQSFNSDGFTLGSEGEMNANSSTFASWNWKAGTTGSGNTTGSGTYKTYSYSVNTTAGFSIVKYTGNGTTGQQIPHHLGAVPKMVIQKRLSTDGAGWNTYNHTQGINYLELNSTNAVASDTGKYNAVPTSTYVQIGNDGGMNSNDGQHILYCFAEKTGYSKFGSYTGNGNADGTFVYTGFAPSFVLVKRIDGAHDWRLRDNKRPEYNLINKTLYPNGNWAEGTGDVKDFLSNGFKFRTSGGSDNNSGSTFIYMAFGQSLVGSNNIPCTAR